MKAFRMSLVLAWVAPVFLIAPTCVASKNPVAHVDIKVTKNYEGHQVLPRPDRVVVYDFMVEHDAIKTDRMPGLRQRIKNAKSSEDAATVAGEQARDQIAKDLIKGLEKRLKASGIPVEKASPEMQLTGNTLVIHGAVTKIDQGHRMRRGTVGLGAGASDVETECQVSMDTAGNMVLVSQVRTRAKSGKKPGAAVTMGAGAAPGIAAGVSGATAHKSTAQGDAARTGSALAKHIAKLMNTEGWIQPEPEEAAGSAANQ